jgi:hypothetical protein
MASLAAGNDPAALALRCYAPSRPHINLSCDATHAGFGDAFVPVTLSLPNALGERFMVPYDAEIDALSEPISPDVRA